MMLSLANPDPAECPPPPKSDVDRLREYVDAFAGRLETEFKADMVARALLVKACDVMVAADGVLPTCWAASRALDLLAGHWGKESTDSFIENYRK